MATSEQKAEMPPYGPEGETSATKPNPGFQRFTDGLVSAVFLWMFPRSVRPNHLTAVRFILIPVVLVLLARGLDWWAFAVFIVATCTDFIDGAMARRRDQITVLGTYIDPVADKLLVAAVLAFVGWQDYLVVRVMVVFIVLELIFTAVGARVFLQTRSARPANTYGKVKMVFQSVAVYLFLLGGILGLQSWMTVGSYLLWPALALAVVSGTKQIYSVRSAARRNADKGASADSRPG
jgi:CDP-diacylglycerol--glycerol-3-phosphate 3-phosphatidyltransferase